MRLAFRRERGESFTLRIGDLAAQVKVDRIDIRSAEVVCIDAPVREHRPGKGDVA